MGLSQHPRFFRGLIERSSLTTRLICAADQSIYLPPVFKFRKRGLFLLQFLEIFLLSVGLAADAFAVSVCKGLSVVQMKPKHALICGVYFGSFQAFMPLIGYWIGKAATSLASSKFDDSIVGTVCAVIAFILLAIIGGNMIKESFSR